MVVLHRDLPGLHGDTICRTITDSGKAVMVLIFTAAGTPAGRMTGRGLGADDYLPKPFHSRTSQARGRDQTRPAAPHPHLLPGQQIRVSPKEFTLLPR